MTPEFDARPIHVSLQTATAQEYGRPIQAIEALIYAALTEDMPTGDITTEPLIPQEQQGQGILRAKSALVIAGLSLFEKVFRTLDENIEPLWLRTDGDEVSPGEEIGRITGKARTLLAAERTGLNLLQHLCAVATITRRFVEKLRGYNCMVLDTRKTTPLWRWAEKYAVRVGGGVNHRICLSDGVLIKDNHLSLIGGVENLKTLLPACQKTWQRFRAEVEVSTLGQLHEALNAGFTSILLDNMAPSEVAEAVRITAGKARLEASGNITLENVEEYAKTGVDAISIGRITNFPPSVDLHFKIQPIP